MKSSIFAIRLNELLQKKNIKQVALVRLAEEKGIKLGKSQISMYVAGKTIPRKDILHFLAEVLEVEPDWLLGKESANVAKAGLKEDSANTAQKTIPSDTVIKSNTKRYSPSFVASSAIAIAAEVADKRRRISFCGFGL